MLYLLSDPEGQQILCPWRKPPVFENKKPHHRAIDGEAADRSMMWVHGF